MSANDCPGCAEGLHRENGIHYSHGRMHMACTAEPRPWYADTVEAHKAADERCGRAWTCACGACRTARAET